MSIIPRAIVLLAPCIPHLPARSEHALLDQVGGPRFGQADAAVSVVGRRSCAAVVNDWGHAQNARGRQRYLDMLVHPHSRELLIARSKVRASTSLLRLVAALPRPACAAATACMTTTAAAAAAAAACNALRVCGHCNIFTMVVVVRDVDRSFARCGLSWKRAGFSRWAPLLAAAVPRCRVCTRRPCRCADAKMGGGASDRWKRPSCPGVPAARSRGRS